jgi:CHASE3 domain sensor protein
MKTQVPALVTARAKEVKTEDLVDELVNLDNELRSLQVKEKLARMESLKAMIKERITEPDGVTAVVSGNLGAAVFTPRFEEVVVSKKDRLKKLLGVRLYDELAQFSVKALRQHLNDQQIEQVISTNKGNRRLKEVRLFDHNIH